MSILIIAAAAGLLALGPPTKFTSGVRFVDKDCADFKTHAEAQAFFLAQGPGDPYGLDRDHDGRACEWLP